MIQKPGIIWLAAGVCWAGLVIAGTLKLMGFENTPGAAAATARSLSQRDTSASTSVSTEPLSPAPRSPESMRLILVAHPACPCTRASVAELARVMTRCRSNLTATVLFATPSGSTLLSAKPKLWDVAAAIPGVRVVRDEGGRLSEHLGARTSGQVFLYDGTGHLLFSGGITASRGHEGDNAGADAVVEIVRHGAAAFRSAPQSPGAPAANTARTSVFGCPLFDR